MESEFAFAARNGDLTYIITHYDAMPRGTRFAALYYAVNYDQPDVTDYILNRAEADTKRIDLDEALTMDDIFVNACRRSVKLMKSLLGLKINKINVHYKSNRPFSKACFKNEYPGCLERVKCLLDLDGERYINIKYPDNAGFANSLVSPNNPVTELLLSLKGKRQQTIGDMVAMLKYVLVSFMYWHEEAESFLRLLAKYNYFEERKHLFRFLEVAKNVYEESLQDKEYYYMSRKTRSAVVYLTGLNALKRTSEEHRGTDDTDREIISYLTNMKPTTTMKAIPKIL